MTDATKPDACREAFEAWYSDDGKQPQAVQKLANGAYRYIGASTQWTAWQAAWNARAPVDTQPCTPLGWKLAPLEPTPEMMAAASITLRPPVSAKDMALSREAAMLVSEHLNTNVGFTDEQTARLIAPMAHEYRVMLAAAPEAPITALREDKSYCQNCPTPTLDSKLRIVDGFLSMRIPVETLTFAAQHSDYFFNAAENGEVLVITDQSNFAKSVAHALNVEGEDGSTPVTRMLDKAFVWVVEQGEEGFELAAKGSKP